MNLKEHTLISFIIGLLFSFHPLGIVLSVLGSSLLDLDHPRYRWDSVSISLIGVLVCVFLFANGCQFYLGFPLILVGVICYLAPHRGFTHSFIGIIILSFIIDVWYILSKMLLVEYNTQLNNVTLALIILVFCVVIVSRNVLPLILCFIMMGAYFNKELNPYQLFIIPCLGMLSHLSLDCFTPKGVRLLSPFRNTSFSKNMGYTLIILLIIIISINFMIVKGKI